VLFGFPCPIIPYSIFPRCMTTFFIGLPSTFAFLNPRPQPRGICFRALFLSSAFPPPSHVRRYFSRSPPGLCSFGLHPWYPLCVLHDVFLFVLSRLVLFVSEPGQITASTFNDFFAPRLWAMVRRQPRQTFLVQRCSPRFDFLPSVNKTTVLSPFFWQKPALPRHGTPLPRVFCPCDYPLVSATVRFLSNRNLSSRIKNFADPTAVVLAFPPALFAPR